MVKLFIIDEFPVIRQGLTSVLEKCSGFEVIGDANNAQEALPQIVELKPDIVIMDAFRNGNDNTDDITMIQEKYHKVKIFVLTNSSREQDFINAMSIGVRGYLSKSSEVSRLIDAIRLVAADGTAVYSSKVVKLFGSTLQEKNQLGGLSHREREILNLVARGHSNKRIANLCFLSEATVKAHMRRIMEKLDVKNRAEAVAIGIEKGLLEVSYH